MLMTQVGRLASGYCVQVSVLGLIDQRIQTRLRTRVLCKVNISE